MGFLRDEDFIRDKVPMTKRNIRILSMAHLDIQEGDRCLDIGAGTGSLSLEMARAGGRVTAIETNPLAIDLIKKNFEKYSEKVDLIEGLAPEDLRDQDYDKVFVGGSKGNLKGIFTYLDKHLVKGGVLVLNFILLSNAAQALDLLDEGYEDIEVNLIQSSTMGAFKLFKADNPIYIMKGVKK